MTELRQKDPIGFIAQKLVNKLIQSDNNTDRWAYLRLLGDLECNERNEMHPTTYNEKLAFKIKKQFYDSNQLSESEFQAAEKIWNRGRS